MSAPTTLEPRLAAPARARLVPVQPRQADRALLERAPAERVTGAVLFARYAYPPNALGYCGPGDPAALLGAAAQGRGAPSADLAHLAARFEGAWPYLQLIAGCNRIADPLDPRVVEAYWIGNALLDRVPAGTLARALEERFGRRAGTASASIVGTIPHGGVAHHSFHVFAVYPWLGLLRAGMQGAPLEVLDRCRIRWGVVEDLQGDQARVCSQGLVFEGSRLLLGPPRTERVTRAAGGVGLVADLAPGDTVALHWDWICDRLSRPALARLRRVTARNLAAVNALSRPGHMVAADAAG